MRGVGSTHAEIVPQIARIANVGVLIGAEGEPTLFHPGDTYEYSPDGVDVLALPLGAPWGKVSETVDFARRVAPAALFPVHDCHDRRGRVRRLLGPREQLQRGRGHPKTGTD